MEGAALEGVIALVTGASRGVGKGIVLGLAEAGATVYLTGRSTRAAGATVDLAGTIDETAEEACRLGGEAVPLQCDHRDEDQTRSVMARIRSERGHLDILVNNAWAGYEYLHRREWTHAGAPFWMRPFSIWDDMQSSVRGHYVTSALAMPLLIRAGGGLIVNISSSAGERYENDVAYGVAKAATDRLTRDAATEVRGEGICVVSLYPGLVRTESVIASNFFDLTHSESPQFIGRAIAALACDPNVLARTGSVIVAAELAHEYGVRDIDGSQPRSFRA
jgi:NAD(P)-dependent dehydrogenase (short-subunit alcohol dehydrogenase family)